ncbi:cytochrome c biogenesis CcdA family protein [Actinokineospora sp.]|uniref:cytochrome c biogenesis CcdA family protein n=1 Tax=Actinokineospora sp. TaxID=1872133 RepID=UPI004038408C
MTGELGLALVAGMLATVNPCGFAMLPAYLAFVVAGRETASPAARVGRALTATGAMTAGFVAVFAVFGLLSAPLAASAQGFLPVVTVVIGVAMLVLGVVLLSGREITLLLPKPKRGAPTARLGSMVGYGVAYAIASLSCTIGPFLAVAGIALRQGDLGRGLSAFVAYALGMGLVVGVLAVAAAVAATSVAGFVRRVLPQVNRIGGVLLVLTGGYVGYYGVYELRVADGADPADPVVDAAGAIQGELVRVLDAIGPVPLVVVLAVLTGGVLLLAQRRRRRREVPDKS